jgi:hypothetical protein
VLGVRVCAHHDVFEHRHIVEEANVLKGAAHPLRRDPIGTQPNDRLSIEANFAFFRLVDAGDRVEDRGLAGAVWPDDAGDAACLEAQIDGAHCHQPAKSFCDFVEFKNDAHTLSLRVVRNRRRSSSRQPFIRCNIPLDLSVGNWLALSVVQFQARTFSRHHPLWPEDHHQDQQQAEDKSADSAPDQAASAVLSTGYRAAGSHPAPGAGCSTATTATAGCRY